MSMTTFNNTFCVKKTTMISSDYVNKTSQSLIGCCWNYQETTTETTPSGLRYLHFAVMKFMSKESAQYSIWPYFNLGA